MLLVLACPTFSWQQGGSKEHYSKKSNCARLLRRIFILFYIPHDKKKPLPPNFMRNILYWEAVLLSISSSSAHSPLFQSLVNHTFSFQLASLKLLFSISLYKTMCIYFSDSFFQLPGQNVCLHNELVLRHFRFLLIPSISYEQTKFCLGINFLIMNQAL